MVSRDFLCTAVTTYYFMVVTRRERLRLYMLQDRSNAETLIDFTLVLRSVLPHQYFKEYLLHHSKDYLPYMDIVETFFKLRERELRLEFDQDLIQQLYDTQVSRDDPRLTMLVDDRENWEL